MIKFKGKNVPLRLTLLLTLLFVLVLSGSGCGFPGIDLAGEEKEKEEEFDLSTEEKTLKETKPPIDRQTPEVLETATFALG